MGKVQSRQREAKEWRGRRNANSRALDKHLARVEIKILPTAPVTAEDFEAGYAAHRKERLSTGVMAYFRHHLTNYNFVVENAYNRWGVEPSVDAKESLRLRIDALAVWYFREIGMAKPTENQRRYLVLRGPYALDSGSGQSNH